MYEEFLWHPYTSYIANSVISMITATAATKNNNIFFNNYAKEISLKILLELPEISCFNM